jgi:Mg-chelatase subunit ChlD
MSQVEYKNLADKLNGVGKRVIVVPDPNSEKNSNAFRLARELAHTIGGRILKVNDKIDDMILSAGLNKEHLYAMSKQSRRA